MRVSDFHPFVNHFTVALVTLGVLLDVAGRYTKREGMQDFAWKCLRLSFVFAILSILTGFVAEATSHLEPEAKSVSDYHKTLSFLFIGLTGAAVIIRASAKVRFQDVAGGVGVRAVYYTLLTVGFILLAVNSFLGSELVYSHGVNVRPYERIISDLPPVEQSADSLAGARTSPASSDTSH